MSRRRRNTSAPATSSRSCRRSACRCRSARDRSTCIARCARSNPSPYMYFLDLGGTQIVGSSPEILVRLKNGKVVLRPIAGTRPRGKTHEEDLALEAELLADPKERAEHLMLIDLGRNDVGRVSETGSVKVTDSFVIERYSHVMHIVSAGRRRSARGPQLHGRAQGDVPRRHRVAARRRSARSKSSRNSNRTSATSTPARSATSAGGAMPTPRSRSAPP